eukprot:6712081-Prymnesium_polylepis.1
MLPPRPAADAAVAAPAKPPWDLLTSFWAPRRAWSERVLTNELLVSARSYRKSIEIDWGRVNVTNLRKFVERHDDGDEGEEDSEWGGLEEYTQ